MDETKTAKTTETKPKAPKTTKPKTAKPKAEFPASAAPVAPEVPVTPIAPATPVVSAPAQRKSYAPTDPIDCRSITYGELLLPSIKNTDLIYVWADYGDIQQIEYQDLRALRSKRSQYIYGPLFIIEDAELLEEWKDLGKIYSTVAKDNLDELFALPVSELARKLQSAPTAFKETIKNAASARILSGELDSIAKIKAIDECLGTDLKFYIQ